MPPLELRAKFGHYILQAGPQNGNMGSILHAPAGDALTVGRAFKRGIVTSVCRSAKCWSDATIVHRVMELIHYTFI
jgi:hypothetical protein